MLQGLSIPGKQSGSDTNYMEGHRNRKGADRNISGEKMGDEAGIMVGTSYVMFVT